jgi:hypothetical protein
LFLEFRLSGWIVCLGGFVVAEDDAHLDHILSGNGAVILVAAGTILPPLAGPANVLQSFDRLGGAAGRVVPLFDGTSLAGMTVEELAIAFRATAIVSGDGGGGGSVVTASEAVSGGRYAPEAAAASIRSHR